MNDQMRQTIIDSIREIKSKEVDPHILVVGATGTGKSSLINALVGERIHAVNPVASTTRDFNSCQYEVSPGNSILITDTPGYGEVSYDEEYSRNIVREAAGAHAVLLVLKADDKGYERDLKLIALAGRDPEFALGKPLLIVLNQIDKLPPIREWNPPYSLSAPDNGADGEKARNIKEKISLVRGQFHSILAGRNSTIMPTMAEPGAGDLFGISEIKLQLFEILPDVARFRFAHTVKLVEKASREVLEQLDRHADKVIREAATIAGGAVLANPLPLSDFFILAPIQIGMIMKLASIYGRRIDENSGLEVLGTLGAGFAAKQVFHGVISLLPVAKNIIGPPYAAAATHGIGHAAKAFFKKGTVASEDEIRREMESHLEKPAA